MGAVIQQKRSGGAKPTLGDVLYSDSTIAQESEQAWVDLMRSVAARDTTALYNLYERTHRLIYTLILRITGSQESAEELTLAVLYDVWSDPRSHDPARVSSSALSWLPVIRRISV